MQSQLITQLAVATFCRFLLKTGRRFVYPFAAVVSGALGVSLVAITMLLALNQVAALLAPLFGHLSDRWGYRTTMVWGLALASLAMLAVGVLPTYAALMIGLAAIGLAISICDPALHAYIGACVPFAKRGQTIGLTELAWAGSSLIGIPVAGWLVESYSWHMPFLVMGILGAGGTLLLRRLLPVGTPSAHVEQARSLPAPHAMLRLPALRGLLLYALLVSCASDIFFVTYALWLVDDFQMGVMALGLATVAIGLAELFGDLLTATLADRVGLYRTMLITLLLTVACYACLPLWSQSPSGAVLGIFLLCLAAEFNLVAAMSLCTELQPHARATTLAWFQAASGVGHVVGVLVGGLLWLAGGITGVGLVCAMLCLVSFLAIQRGFKAWQAGTAHTAPESPATGQRTRQIASAQAHAILPICFHPVFP